MTSPAPTTAPAAPASGTRLGNGQLRRLVAQKLAENSGTEHSPRHIAKMIGRSCGAIGNALEVLVRDGHADRTQDAPRRYRANARTASAAAAAPTTATPPPPSTGAGGGGAPPHRPTPPPATAPAPTAAPAAVESVVRPNGQVYHTRTLAGLADVDVLARMRANGVPVLLYGPPGTGKTSLIEAAYSDLVTVQGDSDTTVADFVGEFTQTPEGRFEFVVGPLVRAMREGAVLFIDDATLIPPSVLAVVYPAMDGRREITIKAHNGEIVTAEPGFSGRDARRRREYGR
ncbi:AAA family ATPase [Nocardia sp. XZ_19_369]|uniref:AAA family ATPase n=1 Tax=Nocardia sp. XZ_19_369 TaxID=2769487 RepID=UPI00188DC851|nr:AAA family ATPase [Nocardia sp. XZ_19_369]